MTSENQPIIPLEEGWKIIRDNALLPLEAILEDGMKRSKLFNNNVYSNIYTTCYNMCTQKSPYNHSEPLYNRHGESISTYLTERVLPSLQAKHDEFLLREFARRCENHNIMNKWYMKFFVYLDRYHVKYNQLPALKEAGIRKFKQIIFDNVKKEVTAAMLKLINDEREGVVIDRYLIKTCIESYISMGMGNLEVYENDFEGQLLEATKEYYSHKADDWIITESTPSYLVKVEKVLEEERQRVSSFLSATTEAKLLACIDKELLEKRQTQLLEKENSGCKVMLLNDQLEDLSRMFRLFQRITNGLEPIAEVFKQHILDIGNDKVEQRMTRLESENKENKDSNDDPQFIKDLLSVHDKYLAMVNEQYLSNALFQKSLKDAFTKLVNQDCGKEKTADLIASFCDRLLKKGSTEKLSDSEVEQFLEKTVQLFSYLIDKDIFADIYRNQLAKRLLNQRSASDDMERIMIGKLKIRCGAQFTSKLEGMMNDLAIGMESSRAFESFCKENPEKTGLGKMEFAVQILTTGHWPQYKPFNEINLPSIMNRCTQAFKEYYDSKTSHRRLTWTHSLGNVVVKGTFNKKSYELEVTTLQAMVMLAFNKDSLAGSAPNGVVSFTNLLEAYNMPEDVLKKVLHSLSCGKLRVIKRIAEAGEAGEDSKSAEKGPIKSQDSFSFNEQFTCNLRKVRIPMALLEDASGTKRVEEDRSVAIEAATVRIMKARKTLSHQQLLSEVLSQLAFFKPDPRLIKKRVESLIDREYLERDPENANVYRYLA